MNDLANKVDLVVYTLSGCVLCKHLATRIEILASAKAFSQLRVSYCHTTLSTDRNKLGQETSDMATFGTTEIFGLANPAMVVQIQPRLFPTVVAFHDDKAKAGWEGFAAISPSDIQDASVLEVLRQAASLSRDTSKNVEGKFDA
jgi:hypothetical protein